VRDGGGSWLRPSRILLVALLLLAALVPFTQTSAASRLDLTSPALPMVTASSRCSGATLAVTINDSGVAISGIAVSACAGRTLEVWVRAGSTTWHTSGTVSGSSLSLPVSGATGDIRSVITTIDTWVVPTTWTAPPATVPLLSCESLGNPSLTCTATVERLVSWGTTPNRQYELFVKVTTTSTSQVRWGVTVNLSSAGLPFLANGVQDIQGGLRVLDFSGCGAQPRTIRVQQNPSWGNARITAGSPADLDLFGFETAGGNLVSCA